MGRLNGQSERKDDGGTDIIGSDVYFKCLRVDLLC